MKQSIKTKDYIVVLIILLTFVYFYLKGVDNGLIAIVVYAIHYYTGSSDGSQTKDATIADIAKGKATT